MCSHTFRSLLFLGSSSTTWAQATSPQQLPPAGNGVDQNRTYLGFDRNEYPGDDQLSALRHSFAYAGYWLNAPPGDSQNSWRGKRALLIEHGFGFLILFNGRLDAELRGKDAAALGRADAASAVSAAAARVFRRAPSCFSIRKRAADCFPSRPPM